MHRHQSATQPGSVQKRGTTGVYTVFETLRGRSEGVGL